MRAIFNIFINEFSKILLEFRNFPLICEQISLFEEYTEINLIFNGYNTIVQYQWYLWGLYLQFKELFENRKCTEMELKMMLCTLKECKLFYFRFDLEKDKVWQHYNLFLPFDANISDYQKKMIMYKLSKFLIIQRHFLNLLNNFLKSQLEICNYTVETSDNVSNTGIYDYSIKWNSSKSDLVELVYGLYYAQMVTGKGKKLSLHTFQEAVGSLFNYDLSDYTCIATGIYRRKRNYSVFFSKMTDFFTDFVSKH